MLNSVCNWLGMIGRPIGLVVLALALAGTCTGQDFAALKRRVEVAAQAGAPEELAQALEDLAQAYAGEGKPDLARDTYEKLRLHAARQGDARAQIRALTASSQVNRSSGDYESAIAQLASALKLAQDLGDEDPVTDLLHELGKVYSDSGDASSSSVFLIRALTRMDAKQAPGRYRLLTNLGVTQVRLGKLEQAIGSYKRALELAELALDGPDELSARSSAGVSCIALGEYQRATEFLLQVCEAYRSRGDKSKQSATLILLGVAYECDHRLTEAQAVLDQAHALALDSASPGLQANALQSLSSVHASLGSTKQAYTLALQALEKDRARMLAAQQGVLAAFRASYEAKARRLEIASLEDEARITSLELRRSSQQRNGLFAITAIALVALTLLTFLLRSRRRAHRLLSLASTEAAHQRDRLQSALDQASTLRGLLAICDCCSSIRDASGSWVGLEAYVGSQTGAQFSHGICQACFELHYPMIPEDLAK